VKAELVNLGVAGERLLAKGYGEEHPVGDNATESRPEPPYLDAGYAKVS